MWKLVNEKKQDAFYLAVGKEYNIGRRDCEILISDDMSISRKHAVIRVIHKEANLAHPDRKSVVQLRDVSKLGTLLESGRIANGQEKCLTDGELLIFGTAGISKYRIVCDPIVITTSCLAPTSKKEVKCNILKLGGHLVNEWSRECRMVVMTTLSVTIKAISALLSLKPIVTPQYLEDLVKAVEGSTKLPDVDDYLPTLSESQVSSADVSFKADARRQNLFSGKTFVFLLPSQQKKLHEGLELGGAKTKLITDTDEIANAVSAEDACVMLPDSTGSQAVAAWLPNVQTILKRLKRRMIAESEIGFAVLYCSTETYCNPKAELGVSSSGLPAQSLSQSLVPPNSEVESQRLYSAIGKSQSAVKMNQTKTDQSCSFKPPVPPVKIKEEILSQPEIEQQLPAKTKKRVRDEVSTCEDNTANLESDESMSKKCRLETNTETARKVGDVVLRSTPGKMNQVADSEVTVTETFNQITGNRSLTPKDRSKFKNVQVVKADAFGTTAVGSLEMDFSIGTCMEPSEQIKMVTEDTTRSNRIVEGGILQTQKNRNSRNQNSKATAGPCEEPRPKQEYPDVKPLMASKLSKENVVVQTGYLTAVLPIRVNIDPDFIKAEELPCNLVVTELKSLVVHRPGQQRSRVVVNSQVTTLWKGKPVINFKRFKKVHHSGLPRIIGGRDLVVHESIISNEREDWFRNELEASSQRQNSELQSQEFASWKPLSRKR